MHENDKIEAKSKIKKNLSELCSQLGKTPTIKQYKESNRKPSYDQIIYLYGKWSSAILDAGLAPNPKQRPPPRCYTEDFLIDEFIRVSNEIKAIPSIPVFQSKANVSIGPYKRKFGSWENVKKTISSEYREKFKFQVEYKNFFRQESPISGKLLSFDCPLKYKPRNEVETIILFSLVAEREGYAIRRAQVEFPDLLLEKDGELLRCEAEWLSSSYLNHGHPIDSDIVCLCWRKDREIPGIREIIELEKIIRNYE